MNKTLSLVFDLETTGLPLRMNVEPFRLDNYNNCRVIEIGYVIVDVDKGKVVKKVNHLTTHDTFIDVKNSDIHGITTEKLLREGVKFEIAMAELSEDLATVNTIVAHNIAFDLPVLLSELYRRYSSHAMKNIIGQLYMKKQICTMKYGQKYLGMNKWPKLSHLHKEIFGEDWVQKHRALDDAEICSKCYLHIK
jgi:DNA polymerase III epsilon subunit-like protein